MKKLILLALLALSFQGCAITTAFYVEKDWYVPGCTLPDSKARIEMNFKQDL